MTIIGSAIASVALSETVRYVRDKKNETDLEDVINEAAKDTAKTFNEEIEGASGIDSANIFAIINTDEVESLIDQKISHGQTVADGDLLQAVDCDILSDSVDCEIILSHFVEALEIQMVKQDKLGDILELAYLREIQKDTSKILSNQNDLQRLQNQPRISIDSWEVTEYGEVVPLFAPRSLEKTQQLIRFNLSNVGEGNAFNLESSLFVKPIYDLSSPPIDEIQREFASAEPTSKLRREGREPERSAQNYLESSESADFVANTFVYMNGRQGDAFSVNTTGPFPPGTTPPEGFAVGLKLIYDDNFEQTHEKNIFAAIGGIPDDSLRDFFMKMDGIINIGEEDIIFPEEIHFS